MGEIRGNYL